MVSSLPSLFGKRLCSSRPSSCIRVATLQPSNYLAVKKRISTYDAQETASGHASVSKVFSATYAPLEDIEPFEGYVAGGYYPVRIGNHFRSPRYHIVHKLGHGASSTIWSARDEHLARSFAIKFATTDLHRPLRTPY